MKVGCDVVQISRVRVTDSFAKAILHPNELILYDKRIKKGEFLAGRFAAKEAFMKALGTGMAGVSFRDIEVAYQDNGQPYIIYQGQRHEVSISHDGDYAFAVCIIQ